MTRQHQLIGILLTLIVLFCGIAGIFLWRTSRQPDPAPATTTVTLDFYQMREEALEGFTQVIAQFEAVHPEIRILQQNVPSAQELLLARIQRNDYPSLFTYWPTQRSYRKLVEKSALIPLTGQAFLSAVDTDALAMACSEDAEVYALPVNRNCMEIFYNQDLFEALGLSVPHTVRELLALCETLKASGYAPCVLSRRDGRIAHVAQGILAALCPHYLEKLSHVGQGTSTEAEEMEIVQALQILRQFADYDQEAPFYAAEANQYFCSGQAAMYYTGSYVLGDLTRLHPDFTIGVFPFPGYTEESKVLLGSIDTAVCISKNCAHVPEALTFLQYLTTREAATVYASLDLEASCLLNAEHVHPVSQSMREHMAEYTSAEWIKSAFSYECASAFEHAIRAYVLDGDITSLMDSLHAAFQDG